MAEIYFLGDFQTAEFARRKGSKDKAPRKKRTLLGSIGQGAKAGAALGAAAGTLATGVNAARILSSREGREMMSGGLKGRKGLIKAAGQTALGIGMGAGINALQVAPWGAAGGGLSHMLTNQKSQKRKR